MSDKEVTSIVVQEHVPGTSVATITDLLQTAIDKGTPVEALEKLVALHERVSDRAARQEFSGALAAFQSECGPIKKNAVAKVTTKSGAAYTYTYAELDAIQKHVTPLLRKQGFSYSWDSEVSEKLLTCTCILRHVNGHSERSRFSCPVDAATRMNEQQAHGAALSYAQRRSLLQVLGIATTDEDTDGVSPETIDEDAALHLRERCDALFVDHLKFLTHLGVKSFGAIRKVDLIRANHLLDSRERARAEDARQKGEK